MVPGLDLSPYSLDSVAVNGIIVWLIEKLKASQAPLLGWVSQQTPKAMRVVAALAACISAAGMQAQWSYAEAAGGTLVVSGITVNAVLLFLWYAAKNLIFQEIIYQGVFKKKNGAVAWTTAERSSKSCAAGHLEPLAGGSGQGAVHAGGAEGLSEAVRTRRQAEGRSCGC